MFDVYAMLYYKFYHQDIDLVVCSYSGAQGSYFRYHFCRNKFGEILNPMQILVTNDDGVAAPGLLALVREMRRLGDVTILAPERNWPAPEHVKTLH